ncbi:MAG TPA: hypothetical protein VNP04_30335 [Alphaproteobacteria bacterium]|nr:hypothetical protein [Alphaproteobacteria bacterium]
MLNRTPMDDPASLHRYVYVASNPLNLVDPEGLHKGPDSVSWRGLRKGFNIASYAAAIAGWVFVWAKCDAIYNSLLSEHQADHPTSAGQLESAKDIENCPHHKIEIEKTLPAEDYNFWTTWCTKWFFGNWDEKLPPTIYF